MGARHKLNAAYFNGALLLAGIAGLVMNSWPAFFLVLAVGVITNLHAGGIRPSPKRQ